jgi:hydroxymethylbilane synthase
MRTIKVGTRQSALALTQTGQVIDSLKQKCAELGIECQFEIVKIVTKGDQILDVTLSKVGGKGLFVKEIEQALLDGTIDMAVHSMKDMPSERQDGLLIGAVPERVDPRDCLITKGPKELDELPKGARVGTSSLRRASQLLAHRQDLAVEPIRGNIDSRMRKLETEGFDAIVLASAGLYRMGWADRITAYLPPDLCIPAVGQGALGIECREGDEFMMDLLRQIHHEPSALAVTAERAFLARLNGGCQVPIGAHAVLLGPGEAGHEHGARSPVLRVNGMVGAPNGGTIIREAMIGTDPGALGNELAEALLARGADRILAEARG